jgi:glutathione S-transferase
MKLYRFRYSPYARKVQILLDLMGVRYELVDVPYANRDEIASVTGGTIYVPVLVDDAGKVVTESRDICEHLLQGPLRARFVPPPWQGPIWAYADFADGPLEDVLFRIASPAIRDAWANPGERALYVLIKERKFGPGCVDAWLRERPALMQKAQRLLRPTLETLAARGFLFSDSPTLADAALYGLCAMLEEADRKLLAQIGESLPAFARRVERAAQAALAEPAKPDR